MNNNEKKVLPDDDGQRCKAPTIPREIAAQTETAQNVVVGAEALAAALHVTRRQVVTWLSRGCPQLPPAASGPQGGRPKARFDALAVRAWLIEQGIAPKVSPASAPESAPEPQAQAAAIPPKPYSSPGYGGMLERIHQAELLAFGAWARAVNRREAAAELHSLCRVWLEQVNAMRQVEKDQAAIRRQSAEWVQREISQATIARLAMEIRSALLALPKSLAPQLEGMNAAQREAILENEVHRCLKLLSQTE